MTQMQTHTEAPPGSTTSAPPWGAENTDTLSAFATGRPGPSSSGLINSSIDVNPGCGSSMYFKTKIHGTALNMTGCTNFIWATHTTTLLKGYHGRTSRGFVKINFAWTPASSITTASVTQTLDARRAMRRLARGCPLLATAACLAL